jgi:hypothetical protein
MAVLSPLHMKATMIPLGWNAFFTFLFCLLWPSSLKTNVATSTCETHEIVRSEMKGAFVSSYSPLSQDMVKGWSNIGATFAFHFDVLSTLWGCREFFYLRASTYFLQLPTLSRSPVAARSKAWNVFARSNTGIGFRISLKAWISVCVYSVCR